MDLKIKRILFGILTIITCIIIFIFSSQNGEKSGLTSRGFVRKIVEITGITNNLNEEETNTIRNSISNLINIENKIQKYLSNQKPKELPVRKLSIFK